MQLEPTAATTTPTPSPAPPRRPAAAPHRAGCTSGSATASGALFVASVVTLAVSAAFTRQEQLRRQPAGRRALPHALQRHAGHRHRRHRHAAVRRRHRHPRLARGQVADAGGAGAVGGRRLGGARSRRSLVARLERSYQNAHLARRAIPSRRELRRQRHQLLDLLRGRDEGRALPLRRRRQGGAHRAARADGVLLARLRARRRPRHALRLPSARAVGARRGASLPIRTSCCSTPTPAPSTRAAQVGRGALHPHYFEQPDEFNDRDSAAQMPKSVVTSPYFDWRDDRRPRTPWHETIVYEVHVKGLTAQHPDIAPELRGTYAGLASPPVNRASEEAGRYCRRALAGAPVRPFADAGIEGATELLGI